MEGMALKNLFGGSYAGRRVLITGHTGFKGSWLALWLRSMGADVAGLALDPDTNPSHWELLGLDNVADYRVDLRNAAAVREVFDLHQPEMVFHLAAQPLVRKSYRDPVSTFYVNVIGLVNVLEAIRHCASVRLSLIWLRASRRRANSHSRSSLHANRYREDQDPLTLPHSGRRGADRHPAVSPQSNLPPTGWHRAASKPTGPQLGFMNLHFALPR